MKTCSSVPSRRLFEFTLLWADPVDALIGTSAAHAPSGSVSVSVCLSHRRNRSRINASFDQGARGGDVPFDWQFLDLLDSVSSVLPPGLKFFLLEAEFPQSQSELSHRFASEPVPGPQQLCHRRLDQLVLFSQNIYLTVRCVGLVRVRVFLQCGRRGNMTCD